MVTITDVAKLAGVSVATVSRALHEPDKLRQKTLERVLDSIAQTGFRPSRLAQNFRIGRSRAVLVLVPNLANVFFSRIIKGIEDRAGEAGLSVLVGDLSGDSARAERYAGMIASRSADGVIALTSELPASIAAHFAAKDIPLVFACEWIEAMDRPCARIDNVDAMRRMTQYLLSLGHRSFGIVTGPKDNQHTALRMEGFESALASNPDRASVAFVLHSDYTAAGAYAALDRYEMHELPHAIIGFNDEIAMGVIRLLRERGITVPHDVSVSGFDDIELAQYLSPNVTTMSQPAEDLGDQAMALLEQVMAGSPRPADKVLAAELIVRESTRPRD